MFKQMKTAIAATIALLSAMFAPLAQAALDTAVEAELTSAKADVLLIGGLVFSIAVGIVLYKWFKRAL
jgi:hypothetical protein